MTTLMKELELSREGGLEGTERSIGTKSVWREEIAPWLGFEFQVMIQVKKSRVGAVRIELYET